MSTIFETDDEMQRYNHQYYALAVNVYRSSYNETGQRYGHPTPISHARNPRMKPLYRIVIYEKDCLQL